MTITIDGRQIKNLVSAPSRFLIREFTDEKWLQNAKFSRRVRVDTNKIIIELNFQYLNPDDYAFLLSRINRGAFVCTLSGAGTQTDFSDSFFLTSQNKNPSFNDTQLNFSITLTPANA